MNKELIRVTKRFTFEMGHALYNYDGKCQFIHGHSYKLYVTLMGNVMNTPLHPKDGMVIDFSVLKKIVNKKIVEVYDHSFVINNGDKRDFLRDSMNERTIELDVQPTCENLLLHFKGIIEKELPEGLNLVNVRLYETEDSYAEWEYKDQIV